MNRENYLNFNLSNSFDKELSKLKLDIDYDEIIDLSLINYQKPKGVNSNILINLEKKGNNYNIKNASLKEGDNSINLKGLKLRNNKLSSLEKISIQTFNNAIKNNDFEILYGGKILIKGSLFDARNLPKQFKMKSTNRLASISKDIEIDLANIVAPLSENLNNFKLIGRIEKGKFTKISSKGDYGDGNYLDISMKNDEKSKIKYLDIYSDLTKPLLTEYSFFKGLTGGKLLFSSVIDKKTVNSKLKIEDFKVVNAPGMIKLLSLADLGGLADLAKGEGISFDTLDISMKKSGDILKIEEILALGPSVSILMEGYQDQSTTSLRGTLVPAKTLNKMIAKIPVLGDIIIPKEVGEGLFGISFKMKGPSGKIKTTINPIRTITPRFIQKIIDKKNKTK